MMPLYQHNNSMEPLVEPKSNNLLSGRNVIADILPENTSDLNFESEYEALKKITHVLKFISSK